MKLGLVKSKISILKYRFSTKKRVHLSIRSSIYGDVFFEGNNRVCKYTLLHNVSFGRGSYIGEQGVLRQCSVGRYCCIANNVRIVDGRHPTKVFVSSHPAFYAVWHPCGFSYVDTNKFEEHVYTDNEKKYWVEVGNDVWIGTGVNILEGVKIGDGAIVAAGAVVTKDIEPYSIVGGVPAKVIGYRFPLDQIEFLLKLKWWDREENWIKEHAEHFYDIAVLKEMIEKEGAI